MEEFIKYLSKPEVFEDIKESYLVSAQFEPDDVSEEQKVEHLKENSESIFRDFYKELCEGEWKVKTTEEIVTELREGQVEKSSLVMMFDSWLDEDETKFKYEPKKAPPPPPAPVPSPVPPSPVPHKQQPPTPAIHSINTQPPPAHSTTFSNPPVPSYSNIPPNPTYSAPLTPNHTHNKPQSKMDGGPFHLEKQPIVPSQVPPSPIPRTVAPQHNPPPIVNTPTPYHPPPSVQQHHHHPQPSVQKGNDPYLLVQPTPQRNLRTEEKAKPKLMDKLMEFLDSPERFAITRAEVAPYFGRKNDHK